MLLSTSLIPRHEIIFLFAISTTSPLQKPPSIMPKNVPVVVMRKYFLIDTGTKPLFCYYNNIGFTVFHKNTNIVALGYDATNVSKKDTMKMVFIPQLNMTCTNGLFSYIFIVRYVHDWQGPT